MRLCKVGRSRMSMSMTISNLAKIFQVMLIVLRNSSISILSTSNLNKRMLGALALLGQDPLSSKLVSLPAKIRMERSLCLTWNQEQSQPLFRNGKQIKRILQFHAKLFALKTKIKTLHYAASIAQLCPLPRTCLSV